MSYNNNYSFLSTLDSLAFETTEQPMTTTEEAAEDLALWTNAKFTYDIAPGQGILDNKTLDMDKKMYDQLAKYLNIDLVSSAPLLPSSEPSSTTTSATTTPNTSTNNSPINNLSESFKPIVARPSPPTLLPKPITTNINNNNNNNNTFALPILPVSTTSSSPMLINPSIVNNNTTNITNDNNNKKRSLSNDSSVNPADDDKRRRNTAASARFRVKKKLKEQALTQSVREMTEKADKLQNRVHELENEIKWLRDLLLEKNGKN
ncbi:hypothetical protein BJ944DRAFT_244737 [Cunninghamella echinulata]|nr:hypothetical protein BJ944DRAFT_244737 [Cunninghamella echinulata]